MIERDDNIPAFPELRKELAIAEKIARNTLTKEQLQLSNHSLLQGVA